MIYLILCLLINQGLENLLSVFWHTLRISHVKLITQGHASLNLLFIVIDPLSTFCSNLLCSHLLLSFFLVLFRLGVMTWRYWAGLWWLNCRLVVTYLRNRYIGLGLFKAGHRGLSWGFVVAKVYSSGGRSINVSLWAKSLICPLI